MRTGRKTDVMVGDIFSFAKMSRHFIAVVVSKDVVKHAECRSYHHDCYYEQSLSHAERFMGLIGSGLGSLEQNLNPCSPCMPCSIKYVLLFHESRPRCELARSNGRHTSTREFPKNRGTSCTPQSTIAPVIGTPT